MIAPDVKFLHTGPYAHFKIERLSIGVVVLAGSIAAVARRCGAKLGALGWSGFAHMELHISWPAVVLGDITHA